jgi:hypothetical protein
MKRPAGRKGRSPDADRTPPGGRALERVQQDRQARGLPPARIPGDLTLDSDPPTVPRPRAGGPAGRAPARRRAKTAASPRARKTAKRAKTTAAKRTAKKSAKKSAKKTAKKR